MKRGITELRELLEAIMDLSIACLEEFSDGIQLKDAWAIITKLQASEDFKMSVEKAYQGAIEIPEEVKDLDGEEAIELIMVMLPYIPKLISAAKKNR